MHSCNHTSLIRKDFARKSFGGLPSPSPLPRTHTRTRTRTHTLLLLVLLWHRSLSMLCVCEQVRGVVVAWGVKHDSDFLFGLNNSPDSQWRTSVHIRVHAHTDTHAGPHTHTHAHTRRYRRSCRHTHTHAHTDTCAHAHKHKNILSHTHRRSDLVFIWVNSKRFLYSITIQVPFDHAHFNGKQLDQAQALSARLPDTHTHTHTRAHKHTHKKNTNK